MIEKISRVSLILIWFYHGLVPKILFKSPQEILLNSAFMPFLEENFTLMAFGIIEIIYAILLIIFFRSKILLYPAIFFAAVATIAILFKLPEFFTYAFNPFSINLSVCALSIINIISINQNKTNKPV